MDSDVDIGTLLISEWQFSVQQIIFPYQKNRCRRWMSDIADIKINVNADLCSVMNYLTTSTCYINTQCSSDSRRNRRKIRPLEVVRSLRSPTCQNCCSRELWLYFLAGPQVLFHVFPPLSPSEDNLMPRTISGDHTPKSDSQRSAVGWEDSQP